jgi:hypothetical protein
MKKTVQKNLGIFLQVRTNCSYRVQGQGMHGTSRASGLLTQRMRGPAEFYKFRHPNRSYQRFYGWCLSRQRGRGQFTHTCQAETLQEFFSCREAQSAVHNNPTKTTTSGPMLRRAKSDFLSVYVTRSRTPSAHVRAFAGGWSPPAGIRPPAEQVEDLHQPGGGCLRAGVQTT